jgi:hypothetical protein
MRTNWNGHASFLVSRFTEVEIFFSTSLRKPSMAENQFVQRISSHALLMKLAGLTLFRVMMGVQLT